jgi:alpha-tubulin suppressor-like RCC1 family protein
LFEVDNAIYPCENAAVNFRRSLASRSLAAGLSSLVVLLTTAGAALSSQTDYRLSVSLSKKSFTASEAARVKLTYKFSKRSKRFSSKLSFKKGTKWQLVRSVNKRGSFKGRHKTTIKKLFGTTKIRVGSYKLELFCDYGKRAVRFRVVRVAIPAKVKLRAVSLAAGADHTCAVLENHTIKCWGDNSFGQLGSTANYYVDSPYVDTRIPVMVTGISNAIAVSAGVVHTCALLSDSTVKCWGMNYSGQLGNGIYRNSPTPVSVSSISAATQVAAGGNHTCALLSDGTVECWGSNYYGQLGNGTTNDSAIPVKVNGISTATQVVVGSDHTCALLSDGTIKCWGLSYYGQLGDGVISEYSFYSPIPVNVRSISTAKQVAGGGNHTCALLSDSTVKCWGMNNSGQLGNGDYGPDKLSSTPVDVIGIAGVKQVEAGDDIHEDFTCGLLLSGAIKCWGFNGQGQLGNGDSGSGKLSSTPVDVIRIAAASQLATGASHACALLADGSLKCWGFNGQGQLGNDTYVDSPTAINVIGIP